jgi:hypothetical protein
VRVHGGERHQGTSITTLAHRILRTPRGTQVLMQGRGKEQ